jgi:hypothetical protein
LDLYEALKLRPDADTLEDRVELNGVRIAKRGRPGTLQAGTWISLEPGWTVRNGPSHTEHGEHGGSIKHGSIEVEYVGARIH